MARPGQAQRGNETTYDVDSGLPYRTTMILPPQAASLIVRLAKDNGKSVTGVVTEILERVYIDADGVAQVRGGALPLTTRSAQATLAFDEQGVA